jgi:pyrimidine operon attenuation protein/uracil phosphoribosyltransferase
MNRTAENAASGKLILDEAAIAQRVEDLAQAILKEFAAQKNQLAVVGIQTRGAILAKRIVARLRQLSGAEIPLGILDITLYRDDVHAIADQPEVKETDLPFEIENRPIVLIDDVLFTGRTVRSALNALIDYGRPQSIELAVLVDRGHRELPIMADFAGFTLSTAREDVVDLNLKEIDEEDSVRLRRTQTDD